MDEIGGDPGASFPENGLPGLFSMIDRLIAQAGHRVAWLHTLQIRGMLSATGLSLGLLGLVLIVLLPPSIRWGLCRAGHLETNFRGERIVQSYGLVILCWACSMFAMTAFLYSDQRERSFLWLIGCAGYGFLGWIDDCWGTRKIKGLRGHIRAAIHDHVITTGLIKAAGGGLLALWLGWRLNAASPANQFGSEGLMALSMNAIHLLVCAVIIALGANAINLLDLRPGRASAVFLAAAAPLLWLAYRSGEAGAAPLLLVVIPVLRVYDADARGAAMLGDTGSNLLGGALGLTVAAYASGIWQVILLISLVALHVLAERRSLTELIRNHAVLNAVDRMTGVR